MLQELKGSDHGGAIRENFVTMGRGLNYEKKKKVKLQNIGGEKRKAMTKAQI